MYKATCHLCALSNKCLHRTVFWQSVFHLQSSYFPVATIFQVFFQPLYLFPDQHQSLHSPVCWATPNPQWLSVWYYAKSKWESKAGTPAGNGSLPLLKCSKPDKFTPWTQLPEHYGIIAEGQCNDHWVQFYYSAWVYRCKSKAHWHGMIEPKWHRGEARGEPK